MNRKTALLLLLTVSIAAGVWLFRPAPPDSSPTALPTAPAASSCEQDSACSTVVSQEDRHPAPPAPPALPPPPAESPPPAASAAPPSPPDGGRLREEADRLIAEGRYAEGLEAMKKATELDPSARNHGDLGALLERLTDFDGAVMHLARAAQLDSGNADRWIALANAYYLKVDPGKAWNAERRALQAEPGLVLGRTPDGLRIRKGDSGAPGQ